MKIDVEFDVFKELTARRQSEHHTESAVLRELLGLPAVASAAPVPINGSDNGAWTSYGVTLPNGTELRGTHKEKSYVAKIVNGRFTCDGVVYSSPSQARYAITQTGGNGWCSGRSKRLMPRSGRPSGGCGRESSRQPDRQPLLSHNS